MEITPEILSDVLYDVEAKTFFSKDAPLYPLENRVFSTDVPLVNPADVRHVSEPTYVMHTYHSCWGHAYEFTLGLLSILHEYEPQRLRERKYGLFVLRELWSDDYIPEDIARVIHWDFNHVDYSGGKYRGPYTILHECLSSVPILFERHEKRKYIHFDRIIYGGNQNNQRNIHNCEERYPHRAGPIATDDQIWRWMGYAKEYLKDYLKIKDKPLGKEKTVLFIDRKGSRAFTEQSKVALIPLLGNPVYMEDCSLAEQIQAFVTADIVVAAHGTCLFHLIWSAPGTRVIEIHGGVSPVTKIFHSYAEYLSQDIHQLFTTRDPWDISFNEPIETTEENHKDIERLLS
jgi:hypothetical protein